MVKLYVVAFLHREDSVLLLRRFNAHFANRQYSLCGGKVEANETALKAIKREVQEETRLDLPESAFKLVHTFHRKGDDHKLVALCFKANIKDAPYPYNAEPEKHDDLQFFNFNQLPKEIISAHKQAIECILQTIPYSEHGW